MTPKQRECLDFIETFIGPHRFSPSFEEIQMALGLASKSGVSRLVDALEEQGRITRLPGGARNIEINVLATVSTADLRAELARRGEGAQA